MKSSNNLIKWYNHFVSAVCGNKEKWVLGKYTYKTSGSYKRKVRENVRQIHHSLSQNNDASTAQHNFDKIPENPLPEYWRSSHPDDAMEGNIPRQLEGKAVLRKRRFSEALLSVFIGLNYFIWHSKNLLSELCSTRLNEQFTWVQTHSKVVSTNENLFIIYACWWNA